MTAILRTRTEHAAKYGANIVVPAIEVQLLLYQLDGALAALDRVQHLLTTTDRHQNAFIQTGHLRNAVNEAAALAEGGDER